MEPRNSGRFHLSSSLWVVDFILGCLIGNPAFSAFPQCSSALFLGAWVEGSVLPFNNSSFLMNDGCSSAQPMANQGSSTQVQAVYFNGVHIHDCSGFDFLLFFLWMYSFPCQPSWLYPKSWCAHYEKCGTTFLEFMFKHYFSIFALAFIHLCSKLFLISQSSFS